MLIVVCYVSLTTFYPIFLEPVGQFLNKKNKQLCFSPRFDCEALQQVRFTVFGLVSKSLFKRMWLVQL